MGLYPARQWLCLRARTASQSFCLANFVGSEVCSVPRAELQSQKHALPWHHWLDGDCAVDVHARTHLLCYVGLSTATAAAGTWRAELCTTQLCGAGGILTHLPTVPPTSQWCNLAFSGLQREKTAASHCTGCVLSKQPCCFWSLLQPFLAEEITQHPMRIQFSPPRGVSGAYGTVLAVPGLLQFKG